MFYGVTFIRLHTQQSSETATELVENTLSRRECFIISLVWGDGCGRIYRYFAHIPSLLDRFQSTMKRVKHKTAIHAFYLTYLLVAICLVRRSLIISVCEYFLCTPSFLVTLVNVVSTFVVPSEQSKV